MPQFFTSPENIENNSISITNIDDIKHITRVLRYTIGNNIDISTLDGNIYKTTIIYIDKKLIKADINETYFSNRKLTTNITLAQSIIKSNKQDLAIQKASELGVNTIVPVISKNTVVKFKNEKEQLQKVQRWNKIAIETVKQCERINLPVILNIQTLKDFITWEKEQNFDLKIVCSEREDEYNIKQCLKKHVNIKNIIIVTGPEGGWSKQEISMFKENSFELVSLGKMIQRAETAIISSLSSVVYEYEL